MSPVTRSGNPPVDLAVGPAGRRRACVIGAGVGSLVALALLADRLGFWGGR